MCVCSFFLSAISDHTLLILTTLDLYQSFICPFNSRGITLDTSIDDFDHQRTVVVVVAAAADDDDDDDLTISWRWKM